MALLLTAAQMRAVDRAIIEKLGLPGLVLMENAGRGVADIIEMGTLEGQPFQGDEKRDSETGSCSLEAAKRPDRLSPRPRGERQPREARLVRGRRSCLFASDPSPADAGVVGLSPWGRGEELSGHEYLERAGLDVRIVCGAGQNGGDGFVIARHLLGRGASVKVFLAMPAEKIAGDAAVFAGVLRALAPDCMVDLSSNSDAGAWQEHLRGAAVIVDALFGTGLRSAVLGAPAAAIAAMNATEALRVAVDIPSGFDADTGEVHGSAVNAHITATMGARKLGLVLDAEALVGRIEVVELGVAVESVLPAALAIGPLCHWLEADAVARTLPARSPAGHKGSAGHLLVIAGSAGKTGAALLAARAGLRTGAGLVTIATTAAGQVALDAKVLGEMTACYTDGDTPGADSFDRLATLAARMRSAVLGPGIPTGEGMAELVRRLVAELPLPMVVDADGLNLLGTEAASFVARAQSPRVLTPHPGEMARLRGCTIAEIQKDRLGAARHLAAAANAVVVLKGARTIIATPDGTAFVNPTANPALGTAGSGDVLSGAIASLLAQGLDAKDAAVAGVFLHGMAADVATRALGGSHLMASDLPDAIARACEGLRPG